MLREADRGASYCSTYEPERSAGGEPAQMRCLAVGAPADCSAGDQPERAESNAAEDAAHDRVVPYVTLRLRDASDVSNPQPHRTRILPQNQ